MRIVKLKGGLGNQMFQYAFAKCLEKETGDIVKLDYSAYDTLQEDTIRKIGISKYCITLESASIEELRSILRLNHKSNSQSFGYRVGILIENAINKSYYWEPDRRFRSIQSLKDYSYFDGYWQSWRYVDLIKNELVRDFQPNYTLSQATVTLKNTMECQNSVFIGVRRGDYSKELSHYGSFSTQYYRNAMGFISAHVDNPVFYIFSNDIQWCKTNIDWGNHTVVFRDLDQQTSDFEELQLMTSCKHAIIVNSTFNWWGATLIKNDRKIVCCPEKWWFDNKPIDIINNGWIKIKDAK